MAQNSPESIADVILHGLCIGCGLCEAVGGNRHKMRMTSSGSPRPGDAHRFSPQQEQLLLATCPGIAIEPRQSYGGRIDPVRGAYRMMCHAWAGDSEIRYQSAAGGVLTALACHLLNTGRVAFILHVRPDPEAAMRSVWTISETPQQALAAAGSRYGPVAPLAGITKALDRGQPFAIVSKPCDLSAVHNLSKHDPRVDRFCLFRFALVCGGQSRLKKSQAVLDEFGLTEAELRLFRYRGHGNPGKTRIETRDGVCHERTYNELWEDEAGWELETRCKVCPDALGEAADVSAADVWPGGSPTGEDEGYNGIVVRTCAGEELVAEATGAHAIVLGAPISPREFNAFQPHQVRKKRALAARFAGMADAGSAVLTARNLRLDALGRKLSDAETERERNGTAQRVLEGRFAEEPT